MKQNCHHLILAASLLCVLPALGEPSVQPEIQPLEVFIIDDQTGVELARDHGIQSVEVEDLIGLIKGVLEAGKPAKLIHLAVDDDAEDNPIGRLTFSPFEGGKPPRGPSQTLPMRVFTAEAKKYKQARAEWQRGIAAYQQETVENANAFIRQVAVTQLKVAETFDDMLAERNGRDFNRSDILGSITTANRLLGNKGRRVLILNTDAKDLPAKRAPRKTPLVANELDPAVELIFVNTSHLPQREPLFRGIPNRIHEVPSMKAAFAIVARILAEEDK